MIICCYLAFHFFCSLIGREEGIDAGSTAEKGRSRQASRHWRQRSAYILIFWTEKSAISFVIHSKFPAADTQSLCDPNLLNWFSFSIFECHFRSEDAWETLRVITSPLHSSTKMFLSWNSFPQERYRYENMQFLVRLCYFLIFTRQMQHIEPSVTLKFMRICRLTLLFKNSAVCGKWWWRIWR